MEVQIKDLGDLAPWFDHHTGTALVLLAVGSNGALENAERLLLLVHQQKLGMKNKSASIMVRKLHIEHGDDFMRAVCDTLVHYVPRVAVPQLVQLIRAELLKRRQLRLPGVG